MSVETTAPPWSRYGVGHGGEVRAGGRAVARFGDWKLSAQGEWGVYNPDGPWACRGEGHDINTFWLKRATTFDLVLDVGNVTWHWSGVRYIPDGKLTIFGTGPPERRRKR